MDFGAWDGQRWDHIRQQEVDTWCAHFLDHAPGGGETLRQLFLRVSEWRQQHVAHRPRLVVAHAGWMLAHRWLDTHADLPQQAAQWPQPPAYGERWPLNTLNSAQ